VTVRAEFYVQPQNQQPSIDPSIVLEVDSLADPTTEVTSDPVASCAAVDGAAEDPKDAPGVPDSLPTRFPSR
jgi:hypothetical protein